MSTRRLQFGVKEVTENADPNIKQRIRRSYDTPYECRYCTKKFMLKCNLNKHELMHMLVRHEPQNVDLKSKNQLKKNQTTSAVTKHDKMSDEKCKKTLMKEDAPNDSLEKPFECDLCHKKFDKKSRLDRHKYVHWKGEERWDCNLCSMDFSTENSLISHKRIHSWIVSLEPNLPFQCDQSILIFQSDESELIGADLCNGDDIDAADQQQSDNQIIILDTDEEIALHQNQNPIDSAEQNVEQSVKRKRSPRKTEPCKVEKVNPTEQTIKKKLRSDNKMNDKSPNTRSKPKSQQSSAHHKTQARVQCDECPTYLSSMKLLRRHKLMHSDERPFKCHYCDKAFYRNDKKIAHERVHKRT